METVYSEDRIKYLASQIAGMFIRSVRSEQLGNIALEVIVAREAAEEIIKGKYSREDKEKAQKTLKELKEMEKNIVRLYFLTKFGSARPKKTPFLDYVISKYSPTE